MNKSPLILTVVVLAAILIILSFAVVLVPDQIAVIGSVAGVVMVIAIVALIVMLFRMRGSA